MIGWQNLAAFWALPILAAPIVIHLLRRHRAPRVLFPSLRFVRGAQSSAARLRRVSDLLLLVLRLGVLASVLAAVGRPVALTRSRLATWNASMSRAIVVDTSASMGRDGGGERARQAADEEAKGAAFSRRFDVPAIADGLDRAAAWLPSTPPSRKEIVVISDAQRGALDPASIARVPDTIGLRVVSVGRAVSATRIDAATLLGPGAEETRAQIVALTTEATALTIERRPGARRAGIRIVPDTASDRLLRIVARAGAVAGTPDQPIVIRFPGADASSLPSSLTPIRAGWMLRTVLRLEQSLASESDRTAHTAVLENRGSNRWTVVASDTAGMPIAAAATSGSELVLDVAAPADSFFAAAITRAVLNARVIPDDYQEQEIAQVDSMTLGAWTRPAGPVESGAWRQADVTDARWCWLLAIVLLGAEQWLRRRPVGRAAREVTRAAA